MDGLILRENRSIAELEKTIQFLTDDTCRFIVFDFDNHNYIIEASRTALTFFDLGNPLLKAEICS